MVLPDGPPHLTDRIAVDEVAEVGPWAKPRRSRDAHQHVVVPRDEGAAVGRRQAIAFEIAKAVHVVDDQGAGHGDPDHGRQRRHTHREGSGSAQDPRRGRDPKARESDGVEQRNHADNATLRRVSLTKLWIAFRLVGFSPMSASFLNSSTGAVP